MLVKLKMGLLLSEVVSTTLESCRTQTMCVFGRGQIDMVESMCGCHRTSKLIAPSINFTVYERI
mgnify:FL=1